MANALPAVEFAGPLLIRLFAKDRNADLGARLETILERVALDCGCEAELAALRTSSHQASGSASRFLDAASQLRYLVECACGSTIEYRLSEALGVDCPRWIRLRCIACDAEIRWFVPSLPCE